MNVNPPATKPAPLIAEQLRLLYVERALAQRAGLSSNRTYMDDLEIEISGCRDAYVGAAVTEIAVLRGLLGGRLSG